MQFRDYYKTLGVERSATQADIKKAFRKASKQYHPDLNKDPGAEDKFKEVNEAYEVLKDPEKRRRYDNLGSAQDFGNGGWQNVHFDFGQGGFGGQPGGFGGQPGAGQGQPFSGFSDFFEAIFGQGAGTEPGGPMRHRPRPTAGKDREVDFDISLEDAFRGATRTVNLSTLIQQADGGRRREEKNIKVKIPAGTRDGTKIRLKDLGEKGRNGGKDGAMLLKVRIREHARFAIDGDDLIVPLPVTPWEAALGAKVDLDTLDGAVRLSVPAGSDSGKRLRLRGKGMPKKGGGAGDLHVEIKVCVPSELSDAERELLEQLAKVSSFNPRQ